LLAYVHYSHRRYGFVGHLFQGRFKSPLVQREGYWLSCGRYIERNPLVAGLVAQPWDYPWSSCRAYARGEVDALLTEDPCYTELSRDPDRRQQLWREFLLGEDGREEVVRRGEWALGDDDFRGRMAQVLGRPQPRPRGRPPKSTKPATVQLWCNVNRITRCEKRPHFSSVFARHAARRRAGATAAVSRRAFPSALAEGAEAAGRETRPRGQGPTSQEYGQNRVPASDG
jgi:hypothetical protein